MTKTIAVANQKGGVGKTTTAVNLAACLGALEYRTLLLDMDPQGNASSGIGYEYVEGRPTMYEVLCEGAALSDAFVQNPIESLQLVPATRDLAGAEVELVGRDQRETILRSRLEALDHEFEYVLIDCPPSLSLLTLNALVASDSVLVPVQTEYYALEGLARLLDTIELVRQSLNPKLEIEGLLLTMHDARNNLAHQVEHEVRSHFGDRTYATVIPRNVRLSESPSFGEPIITYDISSRGAKSYLALAREFVERNAHAAGW